ncbi:MAG: hypothetical protein IKD33_02590, partial [Bacteroidales bacterium]|nr:hypothetical protein [Bacteroidales bacterium]
MNKLRNTIKVLLQAMVCLMVIACGKEDIATPPNNQITTDEVRKISHYTALCITTINVEDINNYTSVGICWSTKPSPTIDDKTRSITKIKGSQTNTITGLNASTKYYVRLYIVGKSG